MTAGIRAAGPSRWRSKEGRKEPPSGSGQETRTHARSAQTVGYVSRNAPARVDKRVIEIMSKPRRGLRRRAPRLPLRSSVPGAVPPRPRATVSPGLSGPAVKTSVVTTLSARSTLGAVRDSYLIATPFEVYRRPCERSAGRDHTEALGEADLGRAAARRNRSASVTPRTSPRFRHPACCGPRDTRDSAAWGASSRFLALISPRLTLFLLWIFSSVLSRAFDSWIRSLGAVRRH